jgi:serine/threonine protein kinase
LAPNEKITLDSFILQGVLGKGSFGKVVQAMKKGTKETYAIKMIPIAPLKKNDLISQIVNEVKVMSLLTKCQYIIKLIDHFEDETNLYLVMELANQGTLADMLNKYGSLKEKVAAKIMRDIILAIEFLHSKNIIHRDLKPENILLDSSNHAKLSDFGWSSKLSNQDDRRKTFCGTPDYIPPEMVSGKDYDNSVDIWCCGVILFEMLHGMTPFTPSGDFDINSKEKKIYDNIKNMKFAEKFNKDLTVDLCHAERSTCAHKGHDAQESERAHQDTADQATSMVLDLQGEFPGGFSRSSHAPE